MTSDSTPGSFSGRDLTEFLSFRVVRLHHALNAQTAAVLDRVAGISLAQWRVLVMVGAGTATTARDISRRSIIDPAMISRTTHALEQAGMLQTHRPESDRRVVELSLTSRGREIYDRTLPYMQARNRELLAHLDPDERDAIYRILEKLESAAGERGILDG